jgi:fatty acid desaturase
MKFTKNIGFLLLAIFLILYGLIALLSLSFAGLGVIMGLLAIAAGVFILLGR